MRDSGALSEEEGVDHLYCITGSTFKLVNLNWESDRYLYVPLIRSVDVVDASDHDGQTVRRAVHLRVRFAADLKEGE